MTLIVLLQESSPLVIPGMNHLKKLEIVIHDN